MATLDFFGASMGSPANRGFTFRYDGCVGHSGVRYLLAQIIGYLLSLILRLCFFDWLGFPHQVTQTIAFVILAIFLFSVARLFVFAPNQAVTSVVQR